MDISEFSGISLGPYGDGSGCDQGDDRGCGFGWGDGSGKCLVDGTERGCWCDYCGDVFGFGDGHGSRRSTGYGYGTGSGR